MSHTRARRRALATPLVATGATIGLLLAGTPAQALTGAETESADTAAGRTAGWLADELGSDHLVQGEYQDQNGVWQSYTDYGLSLDFVYAFRRLHSQAAERKSVIDAMKSHQNDYTGGGAYAGALGKLTHVVVTSGRGINNYGDGKLDDQLRARIVTADTTEHGRAKDQGTDYSNSVGQSFVVRALAALKDPLLDDATAFLLRQQCSAGYFRQSMDGVANSCDASAGKPSVDSTGEAVQALVEARAAGVAGLTGDIREAVRWLIANQRAGGAWVGNDKPNANSTGLAANALAITGHRGAAGNAAAWVRRHQVDGRTVSNHPALKGENGVIAYSQGDLVAARRQGIPRADRYIWQRATAQGALALPSLLPRRTLAVDVRDRAARGSRVKVTVRGLLAGESWTLRRNGHVVANGRVPADRRVVATVRMPDRRTKVRIVAVGSRLSRTGSGVINVR